MTLRYQDTHRPTRNMKAMILAAGLGTRLGSLTGNRPKALVEVNGKTLLERSISCLMKHGISDITVNVHHFGSQIVSFLECHNAFGAKVNISDETDTLLGTGGALLRARPFLDGDVPVLVFNVDVLTDLNLATVAVCHRQSGALATLVTRSNPAGRCFLFDHDNRLSGWKNLKTGEAKIIREVSEPQLRSFCGIHIVDPSLFGKITETGKFSVIDLYLRLATREKIVSCDIGNALWIDAGKSEEFDRVEKTARQMDRY